MSRRILAAQWAAALRKTEAWAKTMRHLPGRLKSFSRTSISAFRERLAWFGPGAASPASGAPALAEAEARPVAAAPATGAAPRRARLTRILGRALAAVILGPFVLIVLFRFVNPPFSSFMALQALQGTRIHHQWRSLDEISPHLAVAVIVSEDARFCRHWGVDWGAIEDALDDGGSRGASTIPMQTAKNLFFWPGRSYLRKAYEAPLAYFMSAVWPKERVIEVYLNIVEWGPGVFGAEAAARHHFHKSAAQLNAYEAAALAAALPNPIVRRAGRPGPGTYRLISRLRRRIAAESWEARCVFD